MNATKTTTITLEIKGQKFELTEAEARQLAGSLNGLLGIPEVIREPWPIEPFQPLPGVPYRTPPPCQPLITPHTSDSTIYRAPEPFADVIFTMQN